MDGIRKASRVVYRDIYNHPITVHGEGRLACKLSMVEDIIGVTLEGPAMLVKCCLHTTFQHLVASRVSISNVVPTMRTIYATWFRTRVHALWTFSYENSMLDNSNFYDVVYFHPIASWISKSLQHHREE